MDRTTHSEEAGDCDTTEELTTKEHDGLTEYLANEIISMYIYATTSPFYDMYAFLQYHFLGPNFSSLFWRMVQAHCQKS